MLKFAYWLGVKLAFEEEGLSPAAAGQLVDKRISEEEAKGKIPSAEMLAEQMTRIPSNDGKAPPEFSALDKSDENDYFNFGHKNYHWAFDDMSRFGLDIQAPTSSAV